MEQDLLNQHRADFIRIADDVLRTPGVPRKVFAHAINNRIIVALRKQNVDEGIICKLRDEAFRIFDSRRAVNNNRCARKNQEMPSKQARGNKNKDIIRYGEANVVERVNGVRR